jgi:hypothetical protein
VLERAASLEAAAEEKQQEEQQQQEKQEWADEDPAADRQDQDDDEQEDEHVVTLARSIRASNQRTTLLALSVGIVVFAGDSLMRGFASTFGAARTCHQGACAAPIRRPA